MRKLKNIEKLLEYVINNDFEGVKAIVESGVDIDDIDDEGGTNALHVAIEHDNAEMVSYLISIGANVESIVHRQTPLQHAVDIKCLMIGENSDNSSKLEVIRNLIRMGSNLLSEEGAGETPLQIAVDYDCKPVIDLLAQINNSTAH